LTREHLRDILQISGMSALDLGERLRVEVVAKEIDTTLADNKLAPLLLSR